MAAPSSSPSLQKLHTDVVTVVVEHEKHTHDSQPNSAKAEGENDALPRTRESQRPAEESLASKLAEDEEKAAIFVKRKAEVVENLAVTAEKVLEEADRRVAAAEVVTQNALGLATAVGGIMAEVAENAEVAIEAAKFGVETAEVVVQGVESLSKTIQLDSDRLETFLEHNGTHKDNTTSGNAVPPKKMPKEELDADQLPSSLEQKDVHEANNISKDDEPLKKKPKLLEEGEVGSS